MIQTKPKLTKEGFFSELTLNLNCRVKFTQQWTGLAWNYFINDGQSIDGKFNNTTITLTTTLLKHTKVENTYFRFGYGPHKTCEYTQGQVSISMNADTINEKKQVYNQQRNYWSVNLKEILDQ